MTDLGVLTWALFLALLSAALGGIVHDPSGFSWSAYHGAIGAIVGLTFGVLSGLLFHEPRAR